MREKAENARRGVNAPVVVPTAVWKEQERQKRETEQLKKQAADQERQDYLESRRLSTLADLRDKEERERRAAAAFPIVQNPLFPQQADPSAPTADSIARARATLEMQQMTEEDARRGARGDGTYEALFSCFGDVVTYSHVNSVRKRHLTRYMSWIGRIRVSEFVQPVTPGYLSAINVIPLLEDKYRAMLPSGSDAPARVICAYDRNQQLVDQREEELKRGFGNDNDSGEGRRLEVVNWQPAL